MKIRKKSAISGKEHVMEIPVNPDDLIAWERGYGNIDELMPYLSDVHREFLLSGIVEAEWKEAFAELTEA